jgi:hypothetical protein
VGVVEDVPTTGEEVTGVEADASAGPLPSVPTTTNTTTTSTDFVVIRCIMVVLPPLVH